MATLEWLLFNFNSDHGAPGSLTVPQPTTHRRQETGSRRNPSALQRTIKAHILQHRTADDPQQRQKQTANASRYQFAQHRPLYAPHPVSSYPSMAPLQLLLCCAASLVIANAVAGLELSPQLLNEQAAAGSNNKAKTQYTPFPGLVDDDVEVEAVELPLDVDQDENVEQLPQPTRSHHSLPPAWLQFADPEPVQKPRVSSNKAAFIKLPSTLNSQHKHAHAHGSGHASTRGQSSCTIEITSKVPGICEPMGMGVGSACISGEFMEVYSASHCTNF